MKDKELNIHLDNELIQDLIIKAKKEGIAFEDYIIKTLKDSIHAKIEK